METSPLANLPGELRNRIWRFTCIETNAITVDKNPTRLPGLLSTCSQIREESYSIYFAENTFQVPGSSYIATFQKIGLDAARLIRDVKIPQPEVARGGALDTLGHESSMQFMRGSKHAQDMLQKQVGYLMVFLKESGLHTSVVQVLAPMTKHGWCDAAWTLVKEAQDSKLAELRDAAAEGEDALGIKLAELPGGFYDEEDASDDELTELLEGSSSEDEDMEEEGVEDEDAEVKRCGGRGASRARSP